MKRLRLFACVMMMVAALGATAQTSSEQMEWIELVQKVTFNDRLSSTFLFQNRNFLERSNTYQNIYWGSLEMKANPVNIGGGLIYFTYHKQVEEDFRSVPEIRPFQYLTKSWNSNRWSYGVRAMVEQRYMSKVVNAEVRPAEEFCMRYRVRLKSNWQFSSIAKLDLRNEIFWQTGEVNQNRASARVVFKMPVFHAGLGYMHWWVNTSSGSEHRHSWLFSVSHQYDFRRE